MEESIRKPIITTPSISGAVCNFKSAFAGLPLKSHVIDVDYTGSAISNCFVVNMADDTNISYFKGLLNGNYGFLDMGTCDSWTNYDNAGKFYTSYITNPKKISGITCICSSRYTSIANVYTSGAEMPDNSVCLMANPEGLNRIYIEDVSRKNMTGVEFKASLSGIYLIYELATPTTPTITDVEFNTLLSAFNISGEAFKIPFDTPIYGGTYDAITGILTSTKASDGSDISPVEYQIKNCRLENLLGENNIWADTGNSVIQPFKVS